MSTPDLRPGQLKILKAVANLLENPEQRITVNAISRAIHVTEGAIYRHYRSKEEIFEALVSYMEANLLTPLNAAQKEGRDTAQRLEVVYHAFNLFLEGHPGLARLLLGHASTEAPGMAERIKLLNAKIRSQVAQILKFGEAQGDLQAGTDPDAAAELFYGMVVSGAMVQAFSLPQLENTQRWNAYATAILANRMAA